MWAACSLCQRKSQAPTNSPVWEGIVAFLENIKKCHVIVLKLKYWRLAFVQIPSCFFSLYSAGRLRFLSWKKRNLLGAEDIGILFEALIGGVATVFEAELAEQQIEKEIEPESENDNFSSEEVCSRYSAPRFCVRSVAYNVHAVPFKVLKLCCKEDLSVCRSLPRGLTKRS